MSCKEAKHDDGRRTEERGLILELAKLQKWQVGGGYNALVELNEGCNNIGFV